MGESKPPIKIFRMNLNSVLLKKRQISQIGEEGRLLSTTVFR